MVRPGDRLKELLEALGPVLEGLVGELRLSFDYFESQHDRKIEQFFLSGGSSRFGVLPALLRSWVPTSEGSPIYSGQYGKRCSLEGPGSLSRSGVHMRSPSVLASQRRSLAPMLRIHIAGN